MSLTSGFYNSISGDRKYTATQLSAIFDGILDDGIFATLGDHFIVSANSGMNINVGSGRAWFHRTWTESDATISLSVDAAEVVLHRIDIVTLEINLTDEVRANSIKIIKGTPSSTPVAPTLTQADGVYQYPLAHIYVGAGVTSILEANITNKVGSDDCPYVHVQVAQPPAGDKSTRAATTAFANSLLAEYEVTGAPVTQIDFSGLDINAHKSYRIEMEIKNVHTAQMFLWLLVNNDVVLTNYYSQKTQTETTGISASTENAPVIMYMIASTEGSCITSVKRTPSGYVFTDSLTQYVGGIGPIGSIRYSMKKNATVTNITQLTIKAGFELAIGIGSKIRIYRGDV